MSEPHAVGDRPMAILLSRDLFFISKVTGTARVLGRLVMTAQAQALATRMMEEWRPRAVFADLAAGDLVAPEALIAYRTLAGPQTVFIAFGSHVDTGALDAARGAGCELVLPRSRFTNELPALIEKYLPLAAPAEEIY